MDEKRPGYSLKAPGPPSAVSLHLPGRTSFPRVDDHLVVPEITRDEIIAGRRVVAHPAGPRHATRHTDLDYVIRAHAAPGYIVASDLLTRHGEKSDFASDTCIYQQGIDPETGARYLEEIAFEVVSGQRAARATKKAVEMHRRGVRRIFAVFVKGPQLCEWSTQSQSWSPLDANTCIEDRCLVKSLSVAALLDAALADNAVAEALITKGNPKIRSLEAEAEAKGRAEGLAESILKILETRGVAVSAVQRDEILRCSDLDQLDRWLRRAVVISSTDELTSEP